MPELPEVETTRRGLAPHLVGRTITTVTLRAEKLRHPLPPELATVLRGERINGLSRRGKYLLFACGSGTLLVHLGMTGHLRLAPPRTPAGRHDHVELLLDNGSLLRLNDPRKFGTVVWLTGNPSATPLLTGLGPEPLGEEFSGDYLRRICSKRAVAIKLLIMNSRLVVGLGNIYANEALFRARINPHLPAGRLDGEQCDRLVAAIRETLTAALARGEQTLDSFLSVSERPVYFPLEARVYGRRGQPCLACGTPLLQEPLGGRSTVWCPVCQPAAPPGG
jgi:formamidopyrimidine-DNA glycosylase